MVFIDRSPLNGLERKEILEAIQERVRKNLGVYELSGVRGADMSFVLEALKRAAVFSAKKIYMELISYTWQFNIMNQVPDVSPMLKDSIGIYFEVHSDLWYSMFIRGHIPDM